MAIPGKPSRTRLRAENKRRGFCDREYELLDTGVFDGDRYFDIQVEYAKHDPEDMFIRLTISNRGPEPANLYVLPTLAFRNDRSGRNTTKAAPASRGCDLTVKARF